ncbi:MAG: tol-pal system YbgF family protein [Acidobacteriota bacterium]
MRTRRTIIETAILALAVLVLTGIPALAGPDEDAYARGRNAVFEERWKDVKEIFDDFSRRFPGSPHTDDAQYWLGMALYEMGQPERAYDVLEQLNTQHTDSPWIDDARVLMVRCAETILKSAPAKSSRTHVDRRSTISSRPAVGYHPDRWFEYEDFLEKSTLDKNAKVQLLAIDTILISRPEKAPDLLPRITRTGGSRQAAGMVLDRFFGPDRVKLTMGDPALGLTEENVDVMVRTGDSVAYLSLSEAVDLWNRRIDRTRDSPATSLPRSATSS